MKKDNLIGQKFNMLTVISEFGRVKNGGSVTWLCKCECGNTRISTGRHLKTGGIKHCGCLYDNITANNRQTYVSYLGMKRRCESESYAQFKDYGGRGIKVCIRWSGDKGFRNFLKDMGERPSKQHTLDRYPDVNGNYEPRNCRWATREQQVENKRSTVFGEFGAERLTSSAWSIRLGLKADLIRVKLKKGYTIEQIIKDKGIRYDMVPKKEPIIAYSFGFIK